MALVTLGWREWVVLPDLGGLELEAKLDTGARTSTLHARGIEVFRRRGREWVRFLPPEAHTTIEMPTLEHREVRSSTGHTQSRYVIQTTLALGVETFLVELTLTDRSRMRYPMLVGRTALAGRFVIDASQVHLAKR
jgi:hypothetical protein